MKQQNNSDNCIQLLGLCVWTLRLASMPHLHLYKIESAISPPIQKGYDGDDHLELKGHGINTRNNEIPYHDMTY